MVAGDVMSLTDACQSFPGPIADEIPRDNILDTIDVVFQGESQVVIVEGPDGMGKTRLLRQFALRHRDRCLSLFINPHSFLASDPAILRLDLCNQLTWVLDRREIEAEGVDPDALHSLFFRLRRRARQAHTIYDIVVDGLHEIPTTDAPIRRAVIDMLPWGDASFRFVLSGDATDLARDIPAHVIVKAFPLPTLTAEETTTFFEGLSLEKSTIVEIYKTFKGVPGYLASLRRLAQTGTDLNAILDEIHDQVPDPFEIEWRAVDAGDDTQELTLALLAYATEEHTIASLASQLSLDGEDVRVALLPLGFVDVDPDTQRVAFISTAFRTFAAKRLRSRRQEVFERRIEVLMRDPDSATAVTFLPGYLKQADKQQALVDYLQPDRFALMVKHSQSLTPVRQRAALGVATARELGRDKDLVQLSMQQSAMADLQAAESWRSEVEARMALGDDEAALGMAQTTPLKEDRLHLLAVIARAQREQGRTPDPDILAEIRQLHATIDVAALGQYAIDIASDLIYAIPELAISMVETSTHTESGENALDWAFAKLSVGALMRDDGDGDITASLETVHERIQDPHARRFSRMASLLLGHYSLEEVLADVEKLESTSDRLFLLRRWSLLHREQPKAAQVTDYALTLAIKTAEFTPDASVLQDIATPIPFAQDERLKRDLVGRFDSQLGDIQRVGPTEDYVKLQLTLAHAECCLDATAAHDRVDVIQAYISKVDDLVTKTSCLGHLVATLLLMDAPTTLPMGEEVTQRALADLDTHVDQLLQATADHFDATRGLVRALAAVKPEMAISLTARLNTQARQNRALLEVMDAATNVPIDRLDVAVLGGMLDRFNDARLRDEALVRLFDRLSRINEPFGSTPLVLPIAARIGQIGDAADRCRACYLACAFLNAQDAVAHRGLVDHLLGQLADAWGSIDVAWYRVDVGFSVVRALAPWAPEKARAFFGQTEAVRKDVALDTTLAALPYMASVNLAVRAFGGLLPHHLETEADTEALEQLITRIPSRVERSHVWSQIALRYHMAKRDEECKRVVSRSIRPLIQGIPTTDAVARAEAIVAVAPALYCAHPATAHDEIETLSPRDRDRAYGSIGAYLLRKQPPSDPYDDNSARHFTITYEEMVDICDLVTRMDSDTLIYSYIGAMVACATTKATNWPLSFQQRAEILRRLTAIVDHQLPRPHHIAHDGYVIAAQASLARLSDRGKPATWTDLVERARSIGNVADRITVLCCIAESMPSKDGARRSEILREAKGLIDGIPVDLDRIDHYYTVAATAIDIDTSLSRECLPIAMEMATVCDGPGAELARRRLVDLAYRLDPTLAASFVSATDNDPARIHTRTRVKDRIAILDMRKSMLDDGVPSNGTGDVEPDYSEAAWLFLGGLNAHRISDVPMDRTRPFVQAAAKLPLLEAYPILSWVIENAIKRYARTPHASDYIRPLFDATLAATRLAAIMAERSSDQIGRATQHIAAHTDGQTSILIHPGEREKAWQYFGDWFESTVEEYLIITDPFFSPEDMEILQLLQSYKPTCRVSILTSVKQQHQSGVSEPWQRSYQEHWRLKISAQDPPDTDIVVSGTRPQGEPAIHDRWFLTKGAGLRLGTSLNSIGRTKISEISVLLADEAERNEHNALQYLSGTRREQNGEKIDRTLFSL